MFKCRSCLFQKAHSAPSLKVLDITSRNGCLGICLMDCFVFAILLSCGGVHPCFHPEARTLPYCQPSLLLMNSVCGAGYYSWAAANLCTCLDTFSHSAEQINKSQLHYNSAKLRTKLKVEQRNPTNQMYLTYRRRNLSLR